MINHYLFPNQLEQTFAFLFNGRKITVIRYIRKAGRSGVLWIYFSIGGSLRASFISVKDLLLAYYRWLSTINLLRNRADENKAIGRANFVLLNVGDLVFHATRSDNKAGVITEKTCLKRLPTIYVNWGSGVSMPEMPWLLECF